MQTDAFLAEVERRADLESSSDARTATRAVLETLGERVTIGETEDIASQLPAELETDMSAAISDEAEEFPLEEFIGRVESREEPQNVPGSAEDHVRAVVTVLGEAVSGGELEDARDQLPTEFERLFEPIDMSEQQH